MHGWQSSDRNNAPLKTNNCLCCAPTHIAVAAFYLNTPYAELVIVTECPMQPLVKAPIGFDAPLSTNLNAGNSANDRGLEQANCANGFEGEDKDLDYILYFKGTGMRLIPLSRVCLNVVLRPDRRRIIPGPWRGRSSGLHRRWRTVLGRPAPASLRGDARRVGKSRDRGE
jgi:hypothetical protein